METSGTTTMTTTVRTTVEDITAVETEPTRPADEADEPLATITLVKMDNKVDDTVSSTDVTAEDLPTDLTPEEDAPTTNEDHLTPEEDMTNVDVEDAPSEEDATSEDNPSSTKEDTRNGNAMEAITPKARTFTIRHPRDFSVSTSL